MNTKLIPANQIPRPSPLEVTSLYLSQDSPSTLLSPESERQLRTAIKYQVEQKNYARAIALINILLESEPDSAVDYNNRGLMLFWQGKFRQALADYNHAIKLNGRLAQIYNNRGNCHAATSKWAEALKDYEIALDLNPANLKVWINQGIALRELGLYDLALENFDLALVLGNKFAGRIYAERAHTYHLRGDWNCALADYRSALSLLTLNNKLNGYRKKVEEWMQELLGTTQLRPSFN